MRQNTCLIAVGNVLRGLAVSAAARPTSSVPAKAKAALTKTEQRPWKPFLKAPGLRQYCAPMYAPPGPPPIFRITPRMLLESAVSDEIGKNDFIHESHDRNDLDDTEDELCLTITLDAEEVDADDKQQ